jgi:hypothetical protein
MPRRDPGTSIIHVNRHFIVLNAKLGKNVLPVYTVKRAGKTRYAYEVRMYGEATLIDPRKHKPLSCGAHAWIEAAFRVEMEPTFGLTWPQVLKLKEKALADHSRNARSTRSVAKPTGSSAGTGG